MVEYLIIGNGVAGTTAAENIRKLDEDGKITIVTDENLPFYYRIRINEYLSGEIQKNDLIAKPEQWYVDQDIKLLLNKRVVKGDIGKKFVYSTDQEEYKYDKLLIASGSHSFVPPIKGSDKKGVFSVRSFQDAAEIASFSKTVEQVVLIGGGLLGLEAGNALRKLGKRVTVVEFFPRLLPRQLDTDGAKILQNLMESMGFSFRLGAKTQEILGEDGIAGVLLEGGETLDCGMVVVSAGVRPNMELAESLNLEKDKGIQVNDWLETSQDNIYAAGDVAEYKGMPYGIWPAAMEQGRAAGINMAGGDAVYSGTTMANTLKVVGIELASAGNIDADGEYESRVVTDENGYKKIVIDNNRIIGCIMLGDKTKFNAVTKAMTDKKDISSVKDRILEKGFDIKSV